MNNDRSERPAKQRRLKRRSMAELAASLQSAVNEKSSLGPAPQQPSPAPARRENVGATINTSLDDANALATASTPLNFSGEMAGLPCEREMESGTLQQDRRPLATAEATQDYRAKMLELMTANVKANLEYAIKLRKLRTPFEFIELSTAHARKQFELIMSQTAAFGELSRSLTVANAERMTAGIESVFGGRKI